MAVEPIFESYGNKLIGTSPGGGGDIDASDVTYNETTVEDALDSLSTDVSGKVNKSGDTMSGVLTLDTQSGTTSSVGESVLILGNDTPSGTEKNSRGMLRIFGKNQYRASFYDENGLTGHRAYYLPDKNGTLALTDDITTMSIKLSAGKTYKITSNAYNSYIICGEYGSKLVYDILAVNNTPLLHHLGTGTDVTCTGISTTEVQITTPNSFAGFIMTGGNRFTIAEVV